MSGITGYCGLFLAAFLAATILPAQSEALLAVLLTNNDYSPFLLILTASIGNILGSIVNWMLGRGIERFQGRAWFPVKAQQLRKAQDWYQRYGYWSLLLSWVPIIGDPLTLAAGIMREKFLIFLTLVSIAKTGRYLALAAFVLWALE